MTLALDAEGQILLAWTDPLRGRLLAAHGATPGSLVTETVHDGSGGGTVRPVGAWAAAAWAPDGRPVIAYQDPHDNDLWLAWRTSGGVWTRRLVASEGAVGFHNDLRVEGNTAWVYTTALGFDARGRRVPGPRLFSVSLGG